MSNINCPGQVVISGEAAKVAAAVEAADFPVSEVSAVASVVSREGCAGVTYVRACALHWKK